MGDSKENRVVQLKPWEVVEFPWGVAVRKRGIEEGWTTIIISPVKEGGEVQEIDVTDIPVRLHDNGIEFLIEVQRRQI